MTRRFNLIVVVLMPIVLAAGLPVSAREQSVPAADDRVFLVLASYSNLQSAIRLERRLEQVFSGVHSDSKLIAGALYTRVLLGPVARGDVERMRLLLESQGINETWALPASEVSGKASREARFIEPQLLLPPPSASNKEPSATNKKPPRKHYNPATLVPPKNQRQRSE